MGLARSDDNGITWRVISKIPAPPSHDPAKCHELHGVQAPDGKIIVQIRDHNCYPQIQTWQTESADSGHSWSVPHVIGEDFPTHLLRFGSVRLLMSGGRRRVPFGIRARISDDSGNTWGEEIVISDDGANLDLGYPSTAEMEDGSLFTLWYENTGERALLRYCRWLPPEK